MKHLVQQTVLGELNVDLDRIRTGRNELLHLVDAVAHVTHQVERSSGRPDAVQTVRAGEADVPK